MAAASGSSLAKLLGDVFTARDESPRHGASILRLNPSSKERRSVKLFATAEVDSVTLTGKQGQGTNALSRCCRVSAELQRIVGEKELPRHLVVKEVWKYVRDHNLQDPKNKRAIICNAELGAVLGVGQTDMLQLSKLLSKHLTYEGATTPKPKPVKKSSNGDATGRVSALNRPVRISEALRQFLGTEKKEMVRSEVVKELWVYIKDHNLQDANNRRQVNCDAKLRDLLKCDSLVGISITKYLSPHFLRD